MTDQTERLAEIRARVEAATPGPWTTKTLHTTLADATFIAASRQDIPYLLDLVDSLTAERDAALAQRDAELAALREKVRAWEALAREAVEEFDDARRYASDGYASEYFTKKWDYNETSVRFQERLGALSNNQEGREMSDKEDKDV